MDRAATTKGQAADLSEHVLTLFRHVTATSLKISEPRDWVSTRTVLQAALVPDAS